MATPERRKSSRQRTDLILELYEPDGKLIVGVGRLIDLSVHGAHFHSTLKLSIGQLIHALIRLDEKILLEIPSKVVWLGQKTQAQAYGVEFVDLSAYSVEKLRLWSQSHGTQFKND